MIEVTERGGLFDFNLNMQHPPPKKNNVAFATGNGKIFTEKIIT